MADVFISYSKKHAKLTKDLVRDLEAQGYTTWWDTELLPDDGFFPQKISDEITAAKAVIVIWAEFSVTSPWVWSQAMKGNQQNKLLQVHDLGLDLSLVPMPFGSGNISPLSDRAKIFSSLARKRFTPSIATEMRTSERATQSSQEQTQTQTRSLNETAILNQQKQTSRRVISEIVQTRRRSLVAATLAISVVIGTFLIFIHPFTYTRAIISAEAIIPAVNRPTPEGLAAEKPAAALETPSRNKAIYSRLTEYGTEINEAPPITPPGSLQPQQGRFSVTSSKSAPLARPGQFSVTPSKPAPVAAPSSSYLNGYRVQLGASQDEKLAANQLSSLSEKYSSVLGNTSVKVMTETVDLGSHGVWFRTVAGPLDSAEAAADLCKKLKATGQTVCIVRKPE